MQILADEFQGSVRFGIVDVIEEEMLKLSYEVMTVPQTFYIVDGMCYEMKTLNIFYDNVRSFIKGEYLIEEKRYTAFQTPTYLVN